MHNKCKTDIVKNHDHIFISITVVLQTSVEYANTSSCKLLMSSGCHGNLLYTHCWEWNSRIVVHMYSVARLMLHTVYFFGAWTRLSPKNLSKILSTFFWKFFNFIQIWKFFNYISRVKQGQYRQMIGRFFICEKFENNFLLIKQGQDRQMLGRFSNFSGTKNVMKTFNRIICEFRVNFWNKKNYYLLFFM